MNRRARLWLGGIWLLLGVSPSLAQGVPKATLQSEIQRAVYGQGQGYVDAGALQRVLLDMTSSFAFVLPTGAYPTIVPAYAGVFSLTSGTNTFNVDSVTAGEILPGMSVISAAGFASGTTVGSIVGTTVYTGTLFKTTAKL